MTETWQVDSYALVVSNLQKVFWPEDHLTKEDMLRYYQTVAPTMLLYLKDRPVTLRVFPDGIHGFSYYRRDAPEHAPTWLRSMDYQPETSERVIQLPLIDHAASLLWLANEGAVEFHSWASCVTNLTQPDVAILDLDPGDQATFRDVLQAALRVRKAMEALNLHSYPKTSGGRGIHVYLPLDSGHTFEEVRAWVRVLAERLATSYPELIAVAHGATHRGGQVTIDHAQNSIGRNTAAPYTLRARPGAPVSAPLTWSEVETGQMHPLDLTLRTLPERLQKVGDLFAAVLRGGQRLPPWTAE